MAPKKQVDQVANRLANEEALKQTVQFSALVSGLKDTMPEKADVFDGYLAKYNDGRLKAPAAYLLCKQVVGGEKMKATFEKLVPGYTHEWSVSYRAVTAPSLRTIAHTTPASRERPTRPDLGHMSCVRPYDTHLTMRHCLARCTQAFPHEHPVVV